MLYSLLLLLLLLSTSFGVAVAAPKLSQRNVGILHDMLLGGNGYGQKLDERAEDSRWICDIITTLKTDEALAQNFVQQFQNGEIPTLIADLPEKNMASFSLINLASAVPSAILTDAEAIATNAVKLFDDIEDGRIVIHIETLPGGIKSDVTAFWGTVTADVVSGWHDLTSDIACFFEGCTASVPTAGACLTLATSTGRSTLPVSVAVTATRTTAVTLERRTLSQTGSSYIGANQVTAGLPPRPNLGIQHKPRAERLRMLN